MIKHVLFTSRSSSRVAMTPRADCGSHVCLEGVSIADGGRRRRPKEAPMNLRLVVLGVDHGELVEVRELGVERVEDGGTRGGATAICVASVASKDMSLYSVKRWRRRSPKIRAPNRHGGRGRLEEPRGHLVRREEHLKAVHAGMTQYAVVNWEGEMAPIVKKGVGC